MTYAPQFGHTPSPPAPLPLHIKTMAGAFVALTAMRGLNISRVYITDNDSAWGFVKGDSREIHYDDVKGPYYFDGDSFTMYLSMLPQGSLDKLTAI